MDPTNRPVTLEIGGEKALLYFDMHTWKKFEELTGKFFMDWLHEVQSALSTYAHAKRRQKRQQLTYLRHSQWGPVDNEKLGDLWVYKGETDEMHELVHGRVMQLDDLIKETDFAGAVAEVNDSALLRMTRMADLHACVYAAWHAYGVRGYRPNQPVWQVDEDVIARAIGIRNYNEVLLAVVNGSGDNISRPQSAKEIEPADEETEPVADRPTLVTTEPKRVNGGTTFGPSDEFILDSAIERLEG